MIWYGDVTEPRAFGFAASGAPDIMPEVQRSSRTLSLTSGDDAAAAKAGPTMQITKKTRARVGGRFVWLRACLAQGRQPWLTHSAQFLW